MVTQSPSPIVDEVAEAATELLALLDDFMVVTSITANDRYSQAVERLRASLVSPPKAAGEPVGFINAQGGFLLTEAGAKWFKAAMANAGTAPVGVAALPLYANHEARGDGVRETDGWKLVPLEPTKEMIDAGLKKNATNPHPWCPAVYRAMVKAAPSVEIQRERVNRLGDDQFPDEGTWR